MAGTRSPARWRGSRRSVTAWCTRSRSRCSDGTGRRPSTTSEHEYRASGRAKLLSCQSRIQSLGQLWIDTLEQGSNGIPAFRANVSLLADGSLNPNDMDRLSTNPALDLSGTLQLRNRSCLGFQGFDTHH